MELRILPANIANMIAAGEVVQRPASVVKELMENAVDAGATDIKVFVKDAGRTLIQVIDNGKGMSPDEAVLCFERHATSKIATAEDLGAISTFGFRGEALASIAAVSEVTLRTRRAKDETGCEVEFADSRQVSAKDVSAAQGANFAVRDLFYNVPARRKFLKSDNIEFRHILEEFTRVALTKPDISFSLTHNDRTVYSLRPAKSLKFRVLDLLGTNVANDVVDIAADTSFVKIGGFIGRPDTAKKALGNQFFFVNGRYFRSPYMHKAVMRAYEDLLPSGVTPTYFIYLTVDPRSVDVNISPTKTEVKFEEESVIFQTIYACVREALGKNAFGTAIDFDREGAPEMPVIGRSFSEYRPAAAPEHQIDPSYDPFAASGDKGYSPFGDKATGPSEGSPRFGFPDLSGRSQPLGGWSGQAFVDRREDYGKLFEQKTLPSEQLLIVRGKYILTQVSSGLMAVNVDRARERIMYERFLEAVSKNGHVTQAALFPVQVQVGAENRTIFDEHAELLKSLGFDISPFGTDTVVVNGVPEGFSTEEGKVQAMASDLLTVLKEDHSALPEMMEVAMAERLARLAAKSGRDMASPVGARELLDALFSTTNAEFTPSGKRISVILTLEQIERLF